MPFSTVSGIFKRIGMGRLGRLGMEPAERYERTVAGELIHIDVKKLGRIYGGAGKRITGIKRNPAPTRTDRDGHNAGSPAGSACTSRSTSHWSRLRRGAP